MEQHLSSILIGLVALGALFFLAKYSARFVLQLRALRRPMAIKQGPFSAGKVVAIHALIDVVQPVQIRGIDPCICYEGHSSVYETDSEGDGSWRSAGSSYRMSTCGLIDGDERIWIRNYPSHVEGMESRSSESNKGFRVFTSEGATRVKEYWLPIRKQVTVVGRLEVGENGLEMVEDGLAGLVLSPRTPNVMVFHRLAALTASVVFCIAAAIFLFVYGF